MAIEYFNAYHSILEAMEPLNDAERGRLFTALLVYSKTGAVEKLSGNERFVFPGLRSQIDRDAGKYAEKCRKQAENGRKGGRPSKANETQETHGFFEEPKKAEKAKEKEKEKEKEKAKAKEKEKEKDDLFDLFWSKYPRKTNKQDALKAWKQLSPDETLTEKIISGLEQWKRCDQWTKDGGAFICYPATFLRGKRWENVDRPEASGAGRAPEAWDDLPDGFFTGGDNDG